MASTNFKDLIGLKFGKLTVLSREKNNKHGNSMWLCLCDCGNTKIILAGSLQSGNTVACGCWNYERLKTHGLSQGPLYNVWKNIKNRCNDPKDTHYKYYGGRGITYDPRWNNIENFELDMGSAYKKGLQIDRIDNNGNYYKDNCRWVTRKQNANNKTTSLFVNYKGEVYTVTQLSEKLNLNYDSLRYHLRRNNFNVEVALRKLKFI